MSKVDDMQVGLTHPPTAGSLAAGAITGAFATRIPRWLPSFAFYVLAPLLLSVFYIVVGAGHLARHLPSLLAFTYLVGLLMPKWWAMAAATAGLAWLTRRRNWPRSLVLALGGILGALLYWPVTVVYVQAVQERWADFLPAMPVVTDVVPVLPRSLGEIAQTISLNMPSLTVWVVIGLLSAELTGVPRFSARQKNQLPSGNRQASKADDRAADAQDDSLRAAQPASASAFNRFRRRLQRLRDADILALEAEDHYVRVHSAAGTELVLHSLGDAIEEMGPVDGLRVHRSFWVTRRAVQAVEREGRGYRLRLANGALIPVGRSYVQAVRQQLSDV